MRWDTVLLLLVGIATVCSHTGCMTTPDGEIVPMLGVRQTSTLQGEGVIGPVMLGTPPMEAYVTAPLKWWGTGTLTIRYPQVPHVVIDGDLGFIIQPLFPQERQAIEASIARGELLIRIQDRPTGLSR